MIRQHLPSLITLVNLFLGFLSILNTQAGNYHLACYFILIAGGLDAIDGKLARLFGNSSDFGKEIDSLADMVSFCLAPSVLVYYLYTQGMPGISGEIIASAPMIFGAIRLARFNMEDGPSAYFVGLPTPINALSITSLVLFIEHIKNVNPEYSQPRLLLPLILALSFMMVSRMRFAKFPLLNFHSGKINNYRIFGLSIAIILFIISTFFGQQYKVLLFFSSFYIILGLLRHFLVPQQEPQHQEGL